MKSAIVIHHSAVKGDAPQANGVRAYHRTKFGQDGSYHYFLEKDGTVVQFHIEEFVGYHSGSKAMNERSVGICMAGDFRKEEPTAAQAMALTNLVKDIQWRWGIPDDRVFLHKDIQKTSCPGTVDWRAVIRDNYEEILRRRERTILGALARLRDGARRLRLTRVLERIRKILGS